VCGVCVPVCPLCEVCVAFVCSVCSVCLQCNVCVYGLMCVSMWANMLVRACVCVCVCDNSKRERESTQAGMCKGQRGTSQTDAKVSFRVPSLALNRSPLGFTLACLAIYCLASPSLSTRCRALGQRTGFRALMPKTHIVEDPSSRDSELLWTI
jgi:hypothetical protein